MPFHVWHALVCQAVSQSVTMQSSSQKGTGASITAACFFLIAVSYKLAWTAISSLLSQFSRDYGPEVLLQLNIAYFLPSIPVLILLTIFNDAMDRKLGSSARGAWVRFLIGLGSLVVLTAYFPLLATSHSKLLAVTACVGLAYGMAFGTSYQLSSRFPPVNTVMLTTGFVSSGPIVLVLDLGIKRGTYYSNDGLKQLFTAVSFITALGLAGASLLVLINRRMLSQSPPARVDISKMSNRTLANLGRASRYGTSTGKLQNGGYSGAMRHRVDQLSDGGSQSGHHAVMMDAMEGGTAHGIPAATGYDRSDEGGRLMYLDSQFSQGPGAYHTGSTSADSHHMSYDVSTGKVHKPDLPLMGIALRVSPAALSIFLSVGTSMLVFPFFTYMHSTGLLGERLAQVLFYVRLVGDILGRLVPKRLQATTVPSLLLWAGIKTAMVPLLFGCIYKPESTGGDLMSILVVAVFWVLSGYVNTCSYLVAPTLVPPSSKSRASGLMTVAFQSSCLIALLGAAAVQKMAVAAAHAKPLQE